jgi:glutamyl/glutaminyl-tRNA synthetase
MLTAGRIGAAAEGAGVARGAMDMTIDYLKQRKQFGRLIGEFQALQHRAAHLYSELEIARAAVIKAQQLLDGGSDKAELIEGFDIERFGAAPTKFDENDLFPLTARIISARPYEAVAETIAEIGVPDDLGPQFWEVTRENVTTLGDLEAWWAMYRDGAEPAIDEEDRAFIAEAMALLPEGPHDNETWGKWTTAVKEATGRKGKGLFMPLR